MERHIRLRLAKDVVPMRAGRNHDGGIVQARHQIAGEEVEDVIKVPSSTVSVPAM